MTGFGSYTYYSLNDRRYIPNDIQQGSMNGNGQAYLKYAERNDLMGNLQLNYAREFGRHSINALALLEAQTQSCSSLPRKPAVTRRIIYPIIT